MAVRPWAPGDSMNRIHWKTTARYGEIQVKEFDLEQTADAWIFLDLERSIQAGRGDESTTEAAIRVAAAVTDRAILENRAVGLTVSAHRASVLPADRGSRQHLKIMQLLAAVDADGTTPLSESLISGLGRVRRGHDAVVITSSLKRDWVRPLASLRSRGVGCVVVYRHHSRSRTTGRGSSAPHRVAAAQAGSADATAQPSPRSATHWPIRARSMTVLPANRWPSLVDERFRFGPREGWVTLALLVIMAGITGWAIDEPAWVIGGGRVTDFLPWVAIGGVLAGFVTAELGWGRLRAHLAGAIAATHAARGLGLPPGGTAFARRLRVRRAHDRPRRQGRIHPRVRAYVVPVALGTASSRLAVFHTGVRWQSLADTAAAEHGPRAPGQFWPRLFTPFAAPYHLHPLDERRWLTGMSGTLPLASLTARRGHLVTFAVTGALALTTAVRPPAPGSAPRLASTGRTIGALPVLQIRAAARRLRPSADISVRWISDEDFSERVPLDEEDPFCWRRDLRPIVRPADATDGNIRQNADNDLRTDPRD
jgi:hypothetical protein